jgi:hypothetical protein
VAFINAISDPSAGRQSCGKYGDGGKLLLLGAYTTFFIGNCGKESGTWKVMKGSNNPAGFPTIWLKIVQAGHETEYNTRVCSRHNREASWLFWIRELIQNFLDNPTSQGHRQPDVFLCEEGYVVAIWFCDESCVTFDMVLFLAPTYAHIRDELYAVLGVNGASPTGQHIRVVTTVDHGVATCAPDELKAAILQSALSLARSSLSTRYPDYTTLTQHGGYMLLELPVDLLEDPIDQNRIGFVCYHQNIYLAEYPKSGPSALRPRFVLILNAMYELQPMTRERVFTERTQFVHLLNRVFGFGDLIRRSPELGDFNEVFLKTMWRFVQRPGYQDHYVTKFFPIDQSTTDNELLDTVVYELLTERCLRQLQDNQPDELKACGVDGSNTKHGEVTDYLVPFSAYALAREWFRRHRNSAPPDFFAEFVARSTKPTTFEEVAKRLKKFTAGQINSTVSAWKLVLEQTALANTDTARNLIKDLAKLSTRIAFEKGEGQLVIEQLEDFIREWDEVLKRQGDMCQLVLAQGRYQPAPDTVVLDSDAPESNGKVIQYQVTLDNLTGVSRELWRQVASCLPSASVLSDARLAYADIRSKPDTVMKKIGKSQQSIKSPANPDKPTAKSAKPTAKSPVKSAKSAKSAKRDKPTAEPVEVIDFDTTPRHSLSGREEDLGRQVTVTTSWQSGPDGPQLTVLCASAIPPNDDDRPLEKCGTTDGARAGIDLSKHPRYAELCDDGVPLFLTNPQIPSDCRNFTVPYGWNVSVWVTGTGAIKIQVHHRGRGELILLLHGPLITDPQNFEGLSLSLLARAADIREGRVKKYNEMRCVGRTHLFIEEMRDNCQNAQYYDCTLAIPGQPVMHAMPLCLNSRSGQYNLIELGPFVSSTDNPVGKGVNMTPCQQHEMIPNDGHSLLRAMENADSETVSLYIQALGMPAGDLRKLALKDAGVRHAEYTAVVKQGREKKAKRLKSNPPEQSQ